MSTHTPGPWKAIEWTCHAPTTVVAEGGQVIADCGRVGIDASEANARLIAAAPEMLAALELFTALNRTEKVSDKVWMEIFYECAEKAEVAVHTARGETL